MSVPWEKQCFDVDIPGLRATMERRGSKSLAFLELYQNAVDADGVSRIEIEVQREKGSRWVEITVRDDSPEGFERLSDAYTMFAKSTKVDDPVKRGMYNLGEKLVIAMCSGGASVTSTKGRVEFDVAKNRRRRTSEKTDGGSVFRGKLTMTRDEQREAEATLRSVLPPKGIELMVNGKEIGYREPKQVIKIQALKAMVWNAKLERLSETNRNTTISVVEPLEGEVPSLYVLGIPVMPLYEGQTRHLDVGHRVPTNLERTHVRKSVMQQINAAVLAAVVDELDEESARSTWVRSALDKEPDVETAKGYIEARYGDLDKLARRTPSDREADHRSTAAGYTVLGGSSLPPKVNRVVREHGLIQTSAQLTPSHKHLADKDGEDVELPLDKWSDAMHQVVAWSEAVGKALLGIEITARVVKDRSKDGERYSACYGGQRLSYNLQVLGRKWFTRYAKNRLDEQGNALLIHELAHESEHNHLSDEFHRECCRLGAKLVALAASKDKWDTICMEANRRLEARRETA